MSQEGKPLDLPSETPAPQLPNFPTSPDDPFQPDIERQTPVTVPPNPAPHQPIPGHTNKQNEPAPDSAPDVEPR